MVGTKGQSNVLPGLCDVTLALVLTAQLTPALLENCAPLFICTHTQLTQLPVREGKQKEKGRLKERAEGERKNVGMGRCEGEGLRQGR